MTPNSTCPEESVLQQVLDDSLDDDSVAELTAHLDQCADCQAVLDSQVESIAIGGKMAVALSNSEEETKTLNELVASAREHRYLPSLDAPQDSKPRNLYRDVEPWIAPPDGEGIGRIDGYRLLECVGRGGMGVVFRAVEVALNRAVAIKLMLPTLLADDVAQERFLREARAAAAIKHPNLVTIYAVAETDGLPYLVSEFVEGGTLADKIKEHGRRPIDESIRISQQILAGLTAAHSAGILHRDIKPSNILLDAATGEAKITDFGIARHEHDATLTMTSNMVGTPGFIAPEIFGKSTAHADQRADLFSVGCVLYMMCAGVPPFAGNTVLDTLQRAATSEPRDLRQIRPATPKWLAMLIRRLMSKDPDDRPATAAEVEAMLRETKPSAAPSMKLRSLRGRNKWLPWVVGVIAMAVFAYGLGVWMRQADDDEWTVVRSASELQTALESRDDSVRIKVDGDGPFELSATTIRSPDVEVVAADGHLPVIAFDVDEEDDEAMITSDGHLHVEGLVFEFVTRSDDSDYVRNLIACDAGSFSASDCRFVVEPGDVCINAMDTNVELSDCEVYSSEGTGVLWLPENGNVMTIRRCIFAGNDAIQISSAAEAEIVLDENRFVVATTIQLDLGDGEEFDFESSDEDEPFFDIEATGNVFDSDTLISLFDYKSDSDDELPAIIAWHGSDNTFWGDFVSSESLDDPEEQTILIESFDDWQELEAVDEEDSRESRPKYRTSRSELLDRIYRGSKLHADDFTLLDED